MIKYMNIKLFCSESIICNLTLWCRHCNMWQLPVNWAKTIQV